MAIARSSASSATLSILQTVTITRLSMILAIWSRSHWNLTMRGRNRPLPGLETRSSHYPTHIDTNRSKRPFMTSKQKDTLIVWACSLAAAALVLILNSVFP